MRPQRPCDGRRSSWVRCVCGRAHKRVARMPFHDVVECETYGGLRTWVARKPPALRVRRAA